MFYLNTKCLIYLFYRKGLPLTDINLNPRWTSAEWLPPQRVCEKKLCYSAFPFQYHVDVDVLYIKFYLVFVCDGSLHSCDNIHRCGGVHTRLDHQFICGGIVTNAKIKNCDETLDEQQKIYNIQRYTSKRYCTERWEPTTSRYEIECAL